MKTIRYRRKREGKTDYGNRRKLLTSAKARLVVRKSNKHLTLQIVKYDPKGDKIQVAASTRELEKYGWKGATSNISAAYLVGLLLGKKAGPVEVIADIGRQTSIKGGRLYAALHGSKTAGIKISLGEKMQPTKERVAGKHTKVDATIVESVKKKIEEAQWKK
ncbi:MAG: 50S ribosomal protein L18 [Candidatus Woesearchaeota archaeon]|jgi:large subunit ribosomal protein L18|nr:50S ribosomal protein L18 [Candidatus Woesearchaeota archaeon]MDP7181776.1 50S ribosomal protein L18 [Candidatus Woesearchaeota archaeon]MDP7198865.1 50S ribosomal protein L18 [Candidatus Woesearchaeota archaeon]MDP7467135.1 50S ribosomal protein L18 [Candidatus Woesearchaeota archaeon]MDP7647530.1 50S ribosomal protein L18 [Candidatus Woesearchaeota archaeon]